MGVGKGGGVGGVSETGVAVGTGSGVALVLESPPLPHPPSIITLKARMMLPARQQVERRLRVVVRFCLFCLLSEW